MSFFLSLFLSSTLVLISFQSSPPDFSGTWESETSSSDFKLILHQTKKALSGSHCAVMQKGSKIDCTDTDSNVSIKGTVRNPNMIEVMFWSSFSNTKGKATIRKITDTMVEWKITQIPKGEFHIPMRAILNKQVTFIYQVVD